MPSIAGVYLRGSKLILSPKVLLYSRLAWSDGQDVCLTSSGYIEILQDIGSTLEEAHAILQEISHFREKNWET